jgi:hypothetical protein
VSGPKTRASMSVGRRSKRMREARSAILVRCARDNDLR